METKQATPAPALPTQPEPPAVKRRSWYRGRKGMVAVAIFLGLIVAASLAETSKNSTTPTASSNAGSSEVDTAPLPADAPPAAVTEEAIVPPVVEPEPEPAQPKETSAQSNARSKAADYLDYTAFSRKGLIEQLKYEGFSTADATYGVDALDVNWYEQAVAKAKDYLAYTSFSRSGLIQQLKFEGFTAKQAEYGADKAY